MEVATRLNFAISSCLKQGWQRTCAYILDTRVHLGLRLSLRRQRLRGAVQASDPGQGAICTRKPHPALSSRAASESTRAYMTAAIKTRPELGTSPREDLDALIDSVVLTEVVEGFEKKPKLALPAEFAPSL